MSGGGTAGLRDEKTVRMEYLRLHRHAPAPYRRRSDQHQAGIGQSARRADIRDRHVNLIDPRTLLARQRARPERHLQSVAGFL